MKSPSIKSSSSDLPCLSATDCHFHIHDLTHLRPVFLSFTFACELPQCTISNKLLLLLHWRLVSLPSRPVSLAAASSLYRLVLFLLLLLFSSLLSLPLLSTTTSHHTTPHHTTPILAQATLTRTPTLFCPRCSCCVE